MASNETIEKYLKLARRAREEGNSEDAKKYYDMLRTEDPENTEARCFFPVYRLWDGKKGEWYHNFLDLCNGVSSAIRAIAESDATAEEKAALLGDYFGAIKDLPQTCNKILNELNHEGSHVTQIKESGRRGMQMLYGFGDAVEKNFSDSEAMKWAVEAWKAGVYRQQQWWGMGLDKTLPESYAAKIKKFDPSYEMPKKAGCISFAK